MLLACLMPAAHAGQHVSHGFGRHSLVVAELAASSKEMPAVLSEWGYDDEIWSQIRSKKILLEWARDGEEAKAKERLDIIRQMTSAEAAPMPALVAECGCDAELWSSIRSKASLVKLAEGGDEAQVRSRINELREAIANPKEPKSSPPVAPGAAKAYRREGAPGADLDEAKIEEMLLARAQAKKSKDYAGADVIQEALRAMGVDIFDRRGTWRVHGGAGPAKRENPAKGGKPQRKPVAPDGKPVEMPAQLAEWGCDAALWESIHSKQSLVKLLDAGNTEYAKKRFERIKELVTAAGTEE